VSDAPRVHVSAMEGKGAYNRNAAIPASGGAFAIPLLEKAAQQIGLILAIDPSSLRIMDPPGERARSRRCERQLRL
jgi:hypothetical protein